MPLAEKEIFSKPYCASGKELTPLELLHEMFGYRSFRPGQEEAINRILMRQDVINVIPTGGGKTVIYTIPSLLGAGISIVISPIIMLMYDQVARLRELGANACYYNSLLTQDEREFILHNLTRSDCQYEFAFTSPEAILSPEFMACLQKLKENNRLQNFIIDEAHCVEVWGKDFRSDYQKLGELRKFDVPVVALTGTATKETISSIKSSLKMTNSTLVKLPCRWHNLRFEVVIKSDTNPKEQLVNMISERFGGLNGIIYCSRQNDTAELAFLLKQHHISATYYHGGMDPSDKVTNASLFLEGKVDAICATNAFGMGIDKKDVRFVIHYALPSSFEDMVQESGRAGRDGEEATCIILFKFSDRMNILRNISNVTSKDNQITMRKSLNEVTMTLSNKTKCRQQSIAAYFEEDEGEPCMLCDNCQKPDNREKTI